MNLNDLIDELHDKSNRTHERSLAKADVRAVLDALADVATRELGTEDGEIPLPGLGKLKAARRATRTGRNPATGAEIEIAAKNTVVFKPAKSLLESIN